MKVCQSSDYDAMYPETFPWKRCTGQMRILGKLIAEEIKQRAERIEKLRAVLAYIAGLAEVK